MRTPPVYDKATGKKLVGAIHCYICGRNVKQGVPVEHVKNFQMKDGKAVNINTERKYRCSKCDQMFDQD